MSLFDKLVRKLPFTRHELVPPKALLHYVGSTADDWQIIGEEFFNYFKEWGDLQPDDRVLDVGCGVGRMAIPLTTFLKQGSYEGFDVWPKGIKWCQKHITARYPNFRFQLVDLQNSYYRPRGGASSATFRFPYPDNSFTFTFLTSVFTHMLPDALENYLQEIYRTLKPGGRCLITYFLINRESRDCLTEGRSTISFKLTGHNYHLHDPAVPEAAIAYNEEAVKEIHTRCLLPIDLLQYGSWCGRTTYLSYQDFVIARKPIVSNPPS